MMLVFGKSFVWTDLAIASGLFMLMAAFTFPLFQILKPGYIGLTIVIGFVSTVLLSRFVFESYSENVKAVLSFFDRYPFSTLFTVSTIIVLCLYALSWILSTTIYRRKAF
ncbi:putative multidrug ABC transporter permease [Paenibacillus sp. 598K]|nr:putative multidrug ABC transporter permease [Paenibacillus sp. 598K]